MSDLCFTPAFDLARLIRARELSPVELLQASLKRIEETKPRVNAFTVLQPAEALAEARRQADRIAGGEDPGPLAGLPLGVKELEDVKGYPSTQASVPFKDTWPERDSVQVERLRAAGAIIVGKTNSPEFGSTAFTKNLLFGVTRNPWNLERTPGGSSGGSSAAIAAGMVPLATGSDGGGSIRIPASYTGCFGIKPTFGRVPKGPFRMLTWSDTSCYGPITRTVRDAALYLDAVVGEHPADPDSIPHPGISYVETLEQLPPRLRIAWSPTLGYAVVQPDVLREVTAAVKVFEDLGHHVEELKEGIPDPGLEWARLSGAETLASVSEKLPEHRDEFGRAFIRGLETLRHLSPITYGEAQRVRAQLVNFFWRLFERYDLLLTPTVATEAFGANGDMPAAIDGQAVQNPLNLVPFTYPINLTRHPAATVRAGFTDSGLPAGLQIVGPRLREDLVLQASYAFEQARPWNHRWPREIPSLAVG
ncbi:MAG: amidase [Chloroflexi bacterium]|nr:amidase [Chloroflexota bacterium]